MQLAALTKRAHLAVLFVCFAATPIQAEADDQWHAAGAVRYYNDDDHITVVSPSAGAQWRVDSDATVDTTIDISAKLDIVSGASIDVVSEASPSPIDETRVELGLASNVGLSSTKRIHGGASISTERDYLSLNARMGGQLDFALHNTTIDIVYAVSFDTVESSLDADFNAKKRVHQLISTFTQVLSSRAYLDAVADISRQSGYLESPYRTVQLVDPMTPILIRVSEEVPDRRVAGALRLGVRYLLASRPRISLHGGYRFYADDWSIESHTAATQLFVTPTNSTVRLSVAGRGYLQTAAGFYQPSYQAGPMDATPSLRTRDRTLGAMASLGAAIGADWVPFEPDFEAGTRFTCQLGYLHYWFTDFTPQADRRALTTTLTVSGSF